MPHHFTKTTVEASIYCTRCGKDTPWRIADGRRQFCLVCYDKPVDKKPVIQATPAPAQADLFAKEIDHVR